MTIHDIIQATEQATCVCGAPTGTPCVAHPTGVHYARLARAHRYGLVSITDFAEAIHDADVFTGLTVLLDTLETTP